MQENEQTAVFQPSAFQTDFSRALILNESFHPQGQSARTWKIFIVLGVLALSLVSFPRQEALNNGLTSGSLLLLVNQDRIQHGLTPLSTNSHLEKAAQAKAENMFERGYFAHTSPEGAEAWDFIKDAGFSYAFAGENLALNYLNPYELEKDFLQSPSHRDNLLSSSFSETGIAVVAGTLNGEPAIVTVQMFASPADGQAVASK